MKSSQEIVRANNEEQKKLNNERQSNSLLSITRKSLSPDKSFSYKVERIKSISLPYKNCNLVRASGGGNGDGSSSGVVLSQDINERVTQKNQERNGLATPLWDSLRTRSGLPHQYQGTEER